MKVLFVYTRLEAELQVSGEAKKIEMQKHAMEDNGVECGLIYHNCLYRYFKLYIRAPVLPIYSRGFTNQLIKTIQTEKYDTLYIRKHIMDYSFYLMLRKVKNECHGIKVIMEIPTYPYDLEWSSLVDFPILMKEKLHRSHVKDYVDKIVTYSNDDEIFGVKCIKIKNGIDPDRIMMRTPPNNDGSIKLLGVAAVEKWHGYDRLIEGIKNYELEMIDGKPKIMFHIVGEGGESTNLRRLVSKYNLEETVFFHGSLHGKELDGVFDDCDIGVGSLGMYRIGMQEGYTLKLKEYAARGIPFIYGYDDPMIEECDNSLYRKYSNDENPIQMESIILFHEENMKTGYITIASKLRQFAERRLTWKEQMKKVVDGIQ